MPFEILEHGFRMLNTLGVNEVELIGSEPTEYSRWESLIQLATDRNISLTVYTSGLHLDRLNSNQVKKLIMHIMFEPDETFMLGVKKLLDGGIFIYLRINFDADNLGEENIIHSFLKQLPHQYHKKISLKYSFTAKTEDSDIKFTDIEALRKIKPEFLSFCKKIHEDFPDVAMYSERPIFKCCFTPEEQASYSYAGLDSRCNMEYTIYKDGLIGLCPPVETLIPKRKIATGEQLIDSVIELRENMNKLIDIPSFKECQGCDYAKNLSCQGGCFSYKL